MFVFCFLLPSNLILIYHKFIRRTGLTNIFFLLNGTFVYSRKDNHGNKLMLLEHRILESNALMFDLISQKKHCRDLAKAFDLLIKLFVLNSHGEVQNLLKLNLNYLEPHHFRFLIHAFGCVLNRKYYLIVQMKMGPFL